MELMDQFELENTKRKLRLLEELYEKEQLDTTGKPSIRELGLMSVKRMINQLTEEIIRYEARQREAAKSAEKVSAN